MSPKTERSNCRFIVKPTSDGKPSVQMQLFQDTIPILKNVTFGFELLSGTRNEDAAKFVDLLNDRILNVFVTTPDS